MQVPSTLGNVTSIRGRPPAEKTFWSSGLRHRTLVRWISIGMLGLKQMFLFSWCVCKLRPSRQERLCFLWARTHWGCMDGCQTPSSRPPVEAFGFSFNLPTTPWVQHFVSTWCYVSIMYCNWGFQFNVLIYLWGIFAPWTSLDVNTSQQFALLLLIDETLWYEIYFAYVQLRIYNLNIIKYKYSFTIHFIRYFFCT